MRRFVRARVADALGREKPALEEYIVEHLQLPMGFPYRFGPAAVLTREVRSFKIAALAKADLPPVRVEALLKAQFARPSYFVFGEPVSMKGDRTATSETSGRYNANS